jgi:multicomponent Na+:H+ antiporter subunit E
MRILSLAVLLCGFWIVSSGRFDPVLMGFMLASCGIVVAISVRMRVIDAEGHPIHVVPRALPYWIWLLVEVIKSNVDLVKLLLQPSPKLEPRVVRVDITQRTDLGRATHANCITLTPGTVTLEVHDDHFLVHALTAASAAGVTSGEMDRRVTASIEGGP